MEEWEVAQAQEREYEQYLEGQSLVSQEVRGWEDFE
jgi:hypothetical protein